MTEVGVLLELVTLGNQLLWPLRRESLPSLAAPLDGCSFEVLGQSHPLLDGERTSWLGMEAVGCGLDGLNVLLAAGTSQMQYPL